MYKNYFKRLLSILISIFGLLVLFPIIIIIYIIIRIDSKGSPIFKQRRLGKNQKEFTVYKFRTMVQNAYQIGGPNSYDGDPRITKVGAFLRKTSLDETPQLINILKGEMSIIGPRPILQEEFEPYLSNDYYSRRYDVLPGLFCTVDVDFRATATRDIQFQMDANYVEEMSMKLDCMIFFKTFISVIKRKNVYNNAS
jgi:lipopolysaccharide/colanic/teichoic acid biosynthesis glycosyltransferase